MYRVNYRICEVEQDHLALPNCTILPTFELQVDDIDRYTCIK